MSKMLKRIPWNEISMVESSDFVKVDDVNEVHGMPKVVTKELNGRLVQEVVFEVTPVEEINKGLEVNDFAIEVLLANGYVPKKIISDSVGLSDIDKINNDVESLNE